MAEHRENLESMRMLEHICLGKSRVNGSTERNGRTLAMEHREEQGDWKSTGRMWRVACSDQGERRVAGVLGEGKNRENAMQSIG